MIRVAQCFTGGIGSEIVRRLAHHPHIELVGVLVHSEDKQGRDVGEIVGIAPIGLRATGRFEDILALRPDVAIWSAQGYDPTRIARLLEAGINVYAQLGGHFMAGQPEQELIESACRRGSSSIIAGGNIPGLISDVLPLFLSGYTNDVRHITAHQRNHVTHYPSASQIHDRLGIGRAADDIPSDRWEWLMGMSARMVATGLGIPFSELRTRSRETRLAPETVTLPGSGLVVEAGTVGGVRWTWDAYSGDHVFLTIKNEQTAVYGLGDDWRRDESTPAWTVTFDASPPVVATMSWPTAVPSAEANAQLNAARAVNFIPALVAAEPGPRSVLDLPLITGSETGRPAVG